MGVTPDVGANEVFNITYDAIRTLTAVADYGPLQMGGGPTPAGSICLRGAGFSTRKTPPIKKPDLNWTVGRK